MIVEVKPLPTIKWHKKTEKDSFTQDKSIEVLYDKKTGSYATGLTPEEEIKYEALLGRKLDNVFIPGSPHPFWSDPASFIKLPNHTVLFDTTKPVDYVKVANLKASNQVANSYKEWEDGLFPKATHYIFDENQQIEIKANKLAVRNNIVMRLAKLTKEDKINTLLVVTNKNYSGRSEQLIDLELEELIQSKPDDLLKVFEGDKKKMFYSATIIKAVDKRVLTKEGNAIFYMSTLIGDTVEDAISWFINPENQELKTIILDKLK